MILILPMKLVRIIPRTNHPPIIMCQLFHMDPCGLIVKTPEIHINPYVMMMVVMVMMVMMVMVMMMMMMPIHHSRKGARHVGVLARYIMHWLSPTLHVSENL